MYSIIKYTLLVFLVTNIETANVKYELIFVNRSEWNAKPPRKVEIQSLPVPIVVIHHSYNPGSCETKKECLKAMKWMQTYHMDMRKWNDIGYNFAVAGDGYIYIGRGWDAVSSHAGLYNNKSIAIVLIGDWRYELPSRRMISLTHSLIEYGVKNGYINTKYHLVGHRQVLISTDCPGYRFYNEIKKWPNYCADIGQCYPLDNDTNQKTPDTNYTIVQSF